jgi:hypothetical protein
VPILLRVAVHARLLTGIEVIHVAALLVEVDEPLITLQCPVEMETGSTIL